MRFPPRMLMLAQDIPGACGVDCTLVSIGRFSFCSFFPRRTCVISYSNCTKPLLPLQQVCIHLSMGHATNTPKQAPRISRIMKNKNVKLKRNNEKEMKWISLLQDVSLYVDNKTTCSYNNRATPRQQRHFKSRIFAPTLRDCIGVSNVILLRSA